MPQLLDYTAVNLNKWLGQPATAQGVVPTTAGLALAANHIIIPRLIEVRNKTGGAAMVGLAGLLPDSMWIAGQVNAAGTTFTPDTTDAQDAGTNDFALETTTQNEGHIIGATVPFGVVSYDITTAGSGTAATHTIEYWTAASTWAAIAANGMLIDVPRTSADWAAGEQLIAFLKPSDWAPYTGSMTNLTTGMYYIRIKRTNATQATAALARRVYVGVLIDGDSGVANGGQFQRVFEYGNRLVIPSYVAGLVGVASATYNVLRFQYWQVATAAGWQQKWFEV